MTPRPPLATLLLRLGRVSNLPTVWTNVLAGAVLGGGNVEAMAILPAALAMSLLYVGGMYLNDGFDRAIDAIERPERPIPAGHISARAVFAIGFGLLGAGIGTLVVSAIFGRAHVSAIGTGALLAALIVLYDAWHKKNPLSPLLMGGCRVLVYFSAALATGGSLTTATWAGAAVLLAYLIGLTYVAKQENLAEVRSFWPLAFLAAPLVYAPARGLVSSPVVVFMAGIGAWVARAVQLLRVRTRGNIPRAVAALIAGISLVDGVLAAAHGGAPVAIVCAFGLPVTLVLHRWVAGT